MTDMNRLESMFNQMKEKIAKMIAVLQNEGRKWESEKSTDEAGWEDINARKDKEDEDGTEMENKIQEMMQTMGANCGGNWIRRVRTKKY